MCSGKDSPRRFKVTITETLKRTVEVEAGDQHEAEQLVSDDWHDSKYILDADDFVEVKFAVIDGRNELSMEEK